MLFSISACLSMPQTLTKLFYILTSPPSSVCNRLQLPSTISLRHLAEQSTRQEIPEMTKCKCGRKSWSSAPVCGDRHFLMFSASSNRHSDAPENIKPAADFYQRKKKISWINITGRPPVVFNFLWDFTAPLWTI